MFRTSLEKAVTVDFRKRVGARFNLSRGIKRDKLHGTNGAEFAVFRRFLQIFADFHFSWKLQHFGGADFRRKPQETADFRRKPQETAEFCRNQFVPFSLSLLIPPYYSVSGLRVDPSKCPKCWNSQHFVVSDFSWNFHRKPLTRFRRQPQPS